MFKATIGLLLFAYLFLSPKLVSAVTITINNFPEAISSDPFSVDVFVEGPKAGINYLRIDLYKEGSSNYFGETYNGTDWYIGSTGTNYYPIEIGTESTTSATLAARIGNPSKTDYPGPGNYKLKVRRYTQSGGNASNDNITPVDLEITYVMPTPTPTPYNPTPTPEPTDIPVPTSTSTPQSTKTPFKTINPTPFSTLKPVEEVQEDQNSTILGLRDELAETPLPEDGDVKINNNFKNIPWYSMVFVAFGILAIGFSGYYFIKIRNKEYNKETKKEFLKEL